MYGYFFLKLNSKISFTAFHSLAGNVGALFIIALLLLRLQQRGKFER